MCTSAQDCANPKPLRQSKASSNRACLRLSCRPSVPLFLVQIFCVLRFSVSVFIFVSVCLFSLAYLLDQALSMSGHCRAGAAESLRNSPARPFSRARELKNLASSMSGHCRDTKFLRMRSVTDAGDLASCWCGRAPLKVRVKSALLSQSFILD